MNILEILGCLVFVTLVFGEYHGAPSQELQEDGSKYFFKL